MKDLHFERFLEETIEEFWIGAATSLIGLTALFYMAGLGMAISMWFEPESIKRMHALSVFTMVKLCVPISFALSLIISLLKLVHDEHPNSLFVPNPPKFNRWNWEEPDQTPPKK